MKKQYLSSFVGGQRYFSSMYFLVFFDKLSNKLLWLFVCYFPDEIAYSSILRNELKRFASGSILSFSFAEKKSQLASNFKLTRPPTIYGEHGIMAHIPQSLSHSKR